MYKQWWWKIVGILLMLYAIMKGLTTPVPQVDIVEQSIRNLFYHVPMWFVMIAFMFIAAIFSILYLKKRDLAYDFWAQSFMEIGMLLGICGCITGGLWARATWGMFWPKDPKLDGVAIGMLMYGALFVLRAAAEESQKAKISSIYAIFVFPIFMAFIYVMPKLASISLHPGSGDTVAFTNYNAIAKDLRIVFYPAILGWGILFYWIVTLRKRQLSILNNITKQLLN